MTDQEPVFASATELLELIALKQVSPVELTRMFLDRIDRLDPQLNSFILVTADLAMDAARRAEERLVGNEPLGRLHGLPLPIKDSQMTAGIRSTSGALLYKDRVPERDAAVVERVKAAGAVILGKTNLPEFGLIGTCENKLGKLGFNPWDTNCVPGGSSGGAAAAVAARLCPVATGSDGGGSIRIPANFCGIYGIKPTHGRVSGYTGQPGPPRPYMFSQNGPLTRTVEDAALLLQAMAGHDPRDPVSLRSDPPDFVAAARRPLGNLRIAWSPDFGFAKVDPEVQEITHGAAMAFAEMGCEVEEAVLSIDPPYDAFGPIIAGEFFATYGRYRESHRERFTDFTNFIMEVGSRVTVDDYSQALGKIDRLKALMGDLFERYDLLLSPTACFAAHPYTRFPGEMTGISIFPDQYWNGAFTLPINVIGHPAATVPAGLNRDGLPVGLHVVGRKYDEETVLSASAAFERARPWIDRLPPVS